MQDTSQQFLDPTFLDAVLRRRGGDSIPDFGGKTRICWLLANAITDRYETDRERVLALQRWVCETVPHVYTGDWRGKPTYYRIHALDTIAGNCAHCVPTSEVFATLAWHAGYPTRVLSIHRNVLPRSGHHINEVFLEGKWCFIDADFLRCFEIEDGTLGNAAELAQRRELIDRAEEEWMQRKWEGRLAFLQDWKLLDEQGKPTYSGLFHHIYIQEGIYSLDGFYGSWIKFTPETADYLYGGPQYEDSKRTVASRDLWHPAPPGPAEPGTERWRELEERTEREWTIPWEPPGWMRR